MHQPGPRPGKPGPKPRADSTTDAPVVRLRIPRALIRAIDAIAAREWRSRPAVIRAILRAGLASEETPREHFACERPERRKRS